MGSLFSLNRGVKYLLFIIDANEILMYSTHNEGKSVAAKRFIKTLKSKIYKRLTATSKKPGLSYLNKLVDEYNNTWNLLMLIILLCLRKFRENSESQNY